MFNLALLRWHEIIKTLLFAGTYQDILNRQFYVKKSYHTSQVFFHTHNEKLAKWFCFISFFPEVLFPIAAVGLRKHCKTVHIQCTEYFAIARVHNLVQNKKFSSIFHSCQENTEKEPKISLIFSKNYKNYFPNKKLIEVHKYPDRNK